MPHAWHVQSPVTAAMNAGSSASYSMRPIISTSSANTAPASGVPNTAPNPAAIPAINKIRIRLDSSPAQRQNALAMLPPICTAVPSRPAEPPNKCVTSVPSKINGAIRRGIPPPG